MTVKNITVKLSIKDLKDDKPSYKGQAETIIILLYTLCKITSARGQPLKTKWLVPLLEVSLHTLAVYPQVDHTPNNSVAFE